MKLRRHLKSADASWREAPRPLSAEGAQGARPALARNDRRDAEPEAPAWPHGWIAWSAAQSRAAAV